LIVVTDTILTSSSIAMDSNSSEDFSNTVWSFQLYLFSTCLDLVQIFVSCCYPRSSCIAFCTGSVRSAGSGLYCCFPLSHLYLLGLGSDICVLMLSVVILHCLLHGFRPIGRLGALLLLPLVSMLSYSFIFLAFKGREVPHIRFSVPSEAFSI
jgi:hypothetical protein